MLLLSNINSQLQLITGSAVDTDVTALWKGSNGTLGQSNQVVQQATTTTIVPAPTGSNQRSINNLYIFNKSTTDSQVVTVRHADTTYNNEVFVDYITAVLYPNYSLTYNDAVGFQVFNAQGALVTVGNAGPTGPTGSQGVTGPQGTQGSQGLLS